jgi:hypothetical protein
MRRWLSTDSHPRTSGALTVKKVIPAVVAGAILLSTLLVVLFFGDNGAAAACEPTPANVNLSQLRLDRGCRTVIAHEEDDASTKRVAGRAFLA